MRSMTSLSIKTIEQYYEAGIFSAMDINFADLGPMVDFDCGNIGYRLLKDFAVTIDQKNHRVRFRSASTAKDVP